MTEFKRNPDLPMDADGVIYHLGCKRSDISTRLIFVGDPGRVPVVAERFDAGSITFDASHREIRVMTGTYKGHRVTVLSTGMGTDNIEIVMNELHALFELDVATQKWSETVPDVAIIRVGTCGSPQASVSAGSLAITQHGLGMDNTCRYYVDNSGLGKALLDAVNETAFAKIGVYATQAHPDVTKSLWEHAKTCAPTRPRVVGATASGSGFYGCQGRVVGRFTGRVTLPNLVDVLGGIRFDAAPTAAIKEEGVDSGRVVNIEMENSAICCLSSMLGYRAGTICAVVAARAGEFRSFATPDESKAALTDAITVGLESLISL